MTRFLRIRLWVFLLTLVVSPVARAQSTTPPAATTPPAHLSAVEGDVYLDREAHSEFAVVNMPVLPGDRVRVESGRADITLPDGARLSLDSRTVVEWLPDNLYRVRSGSATLQASRAPSDATALPAPAAQYLPTELRAYTDTLNDNGTWGYEPTQGYVWYPRVAATWRPYYNGYWYDSSAYGPFWVSRDPWGWATHHYGRWGYGEARGWYWIPGAAWAAAWVYWAFDNDWVSWCPLGWGGYPVFGYWGVHGVYNGYADHWRGWTMIPRHYYGRAVHVSSVHVNGAHFAGRPMPRLTAQPQGPGGGRGGSRYAGGAGGAAAGPNGAGGGPAGGGGRAGAGPNNSTTTGGRGNGAGGGGRAGAGGQNASAGQGAGSGQRGQGGSAGGNAPRNTNAGAGPRDMGTGAAESNARAATRSEPGTEYGRARTWQDTSRAARRASPFGAEAPAGSAMPRERGGYGMGRMPTPSYGNSSPSGQARAYSAPSGGSFERRGGGTYSAPPSASISRAPSRAYSPAPTRSPSAGPSGSSSSPSSSRYNSGSGSHSSSGGGGSSSRRGRGGSPD